MKIQIYLKTEKIQQRLEKPSGSWIYCDSFISETIKYLKKEKKRKKGRKTI